MVRIFIGSHSPSPHLVARSGPIDEDEDADAVNADVGVDTRKDDGDGRSNPILDQKTKKKEADQLTGERGKKPINSIGSANPSYGQRSPGGDHRDRSPRERAERKLMAARVCGLGSKPKLVIPCIGK